ncbi:MAG: hypothetical protein KAG97_10415, partial [Victivallales bacterium]|nr:hypothetical protein [Victivallales bacterium]
MLNAEKSAVPAKSMFHHFESGIRETRIIQNGSETIRYLAQTVAPPSHPLKEEFSNKVDATTVKDVRT